MGRVNTPLLTDEQRTALEKAFKTGPSHALRQRCQLVLLKAEGRPSKEVGLIVKMCAMSVNNWLARYKAEGIAGLRTKPGRGRKALLDKKTDSQAVLQAVKANRQRLQLARTEWQMQSGKSVSRATLRRFLKVLADATNVSEGG